VGRQVWGGKTFCRKAAAGADNLKLYVVLDSREAKQKLLVDPELLTPELLTKDRVHTSIDYFQSSLDGALAARRISRGGSEQSMIHVLETTDPSQPAKMTARFEAATFEQAADVLRVDHDAGYGMGSTRAQHDLEYSDEMSFLLWQDGDSEFQPVHCMRRALPLVCFLYCVFLGGKYFLSMEATTT
jgi:hypothetical protein